MADFLLEIGVEEIPARMIDDAREELARRTADAAYRERLAEIAGRSSHSQRPAAWLFWPAMLLLAARCRRKLTGPSLKIAYKDGVPTPAAEAFARKAGVDVSALREGLPLPRESISPLPSRRKGRDRRRDPRRVASQRDCRQSTGPRACTGAAKPPSALFALSVGWLLCSTTKSCRSSSVASMPARPARDTAFSPTARDDRPAARIRGRPREKFSDGQFRRARAPNPQSARRRHANHSRRALARRQVSARHCRQSHRVSFGRFSAASIPSSSLFRRKCSSP